MILTFSGTKRIWGRCIYRDNVYVEATLFPAQYRNKCLDYLLLIIINDNPFSYFYDTGPETAEFLFIINYD
jgi:hypothetical protein